MKLPSQTVLFLLDLFQRTSIRQKYNFFRKTKLWDREKIKSYQLKRINELLVYSQNNIPYYNNLFSENNLQVSEIKSLEDLKYIPCLTRKDIQKNLKTLVSNEYTLTNLIRSSSSGTTGIPISYYESKHSSSAGTAAGYFAYSLSGWQPGNKTLHIWGNPSSIAHWKTIKSKIKAAVKNQINLASTEFNNPENLHKMYKFIFSLKTECIDGYTTAIYELAKYMAGNNLHSLNVKNVFTTAENLSEIQRQTIEKYVGAVSDLYGCGEINGIAIKPIDEDKYYIIDPHVIVETEGSNENYKSILVTDLDNKAMPLIRYKIGDLIDNVCEPDIKDELQFSFFRKILGRDSDIITLPNGKKILPVNILGGTLFRRIGGIVKHKVVWNNRELTFHFETTNEFSLEKAEKLLEKEFHDYNVPVKIYIEEKLKPDKNGKFKYFEIIN